MRTSPARPTVTLAITVMVGMLATLVLPAAPAGAASPYSIDEDISGSTPIWEVVALVGAVMLPVAILYAALVIRSRAGRRELNRHAPRPPTSSGPTPVAAVPVAAVPVAAVPVAAVPVAAVPVAAEPTSGEPISPEHREYLPPPPYPAQPPQPATPSEDPTAGWPAEAVWRTPHPEAIPVPPPVPPPAEA